MLFDSLPSPLPHLGVVVLWGGGVGRLGDLMYGFVHSVWRQYTGRMPWGVIGLWVDPWWKCDAYIYMGDMYGCTIGGCLSMF